MWKHCLRDAKLAVLAVILGGALQVAGCSSTPLTDQIASGIALSVAGDLLITVLDFVLPQPPPLI